MPQEKELFNSEIGSILKEKISDDESVQSLETQLLRGAEEALEIEGDFETWLERFKYQFLWLDKDDYSRALVRALWLAPRFAGTDFGSSRQRDMGQVWTDTARGFLGEIALSKFLQKRFGVETRLDTSRGELTKFLPTDIAEVRRPDEKWRKPSLKISIKTTKFNGRWLDLPGAQFEHSDVFVLVKIGILRQHFLAFLKAISFLKDKLFVKAKNLGELDDDDARKLWNEIPEFEPLPAYIAGFLYKSDVNLPIHMINARLRGRTRMRIVISQGIGLFTPENLRSLQEIREIDPSGSVPIKIDPIIDSFSGQHFFAHSGGLQYGEAKWLRLIEML